MIETYDWYLDNRGTQRARADHRVPWTRSARHTERCLSALEPTEWTALRRGLPEDCRGFASGTPPPRRSPSRARRGRGRGATDAPRLRPPPIPLAAAGYRAGDRPLAARSMPREGGTDRESRFVRATSASARSRMPARPRVNIFPRRYSGRRGDLQTSPIPPRLRPGRARRRRRGTATASWRYSTIRWEELTGGGLRIERRTSTRPRRDRDAVGSSKASPGVMTYRMRLNRDGLADLIARGARAVDSSAYERDRSRGPRLIRVGAPVTTSTHTAEGSRSSRTDVT